MKIAGLMKMTLLDFPGHIACTVFTAGCDFRCPFCHNASLVTHINNEDVMSCDEFFSFLEKRHGLLDGVCISGGEPLLHEDIGEFIAKIKEMGFLVKLDTNGSFPDRLISLCDRGLIDHVAMDIKNSPEKYAETVGLEKIDLAPIYKSIDFLLSGSVDYEFRTTLVAQFHTEKDVEEMAKMIKGAKAYYLQSFIDSGDLIGSGLCALEKDTIIIMREKAARFVKNTQIRGI